MAKRLYVLIPVLNEGDSVTGLLLRLANEVTFNHRDLSLFVIVVDDGSNPPVLQARSEHLAARVVVLRHEVTQGPGAAFRTAFAWLHEQVHVEDLVLLMEGDGTSPVDLLPLMRQRIDEGHEVVLGSPYLYGGGFENTGILRRVVSEVGNALTRVVLNIRGIWTLSCFYRLYSGREIIRLQSRFGPGIIASAGFEGVVELLARSVHDEVRIAEVPLVVDQSLRRGKSRMKVFRTMLGYFRLMSQLRRVRDGVLGVDQSEPVAVQAGSG